MTGRHRVIEFDDPRYVDAMLGVWVRGERPALPLVPTSVVVLKRATGDAMQLIYGYHGCALSVLLASRREVATALRLGVGPEA